jgi:hypothetical protein
MTLLRSTVALLLGAVIASSPALGAKQIATAKLKDLQPVGSATKKQKKLQYDFFLDTGNHEYTCRSKLGATVKPTEFVVGSDMQFEINGQNGQVTSPEGKKAKCSIVRVADLTASQ